MGLTRILHGHGALVEIQHQPLIGERIDPDQAIGAQMLGRKRRRLQRPDFGLAQRQCGNFHGGHVDRAGHALQPHRIAGRQRQAGGQTVAHHRTIGT